MSVSFVTILAKEAYEEYARALNYHDELDILPMEMWEALETKRHAAWEAVATRISGHAKVSTGKHADCYDLDSLFLELLALLKNSRPYDGTELDNRYVTTISDLEKVVGYFESWVVTP